MAGFFSALILALSLAPAHADDGYVVRAESGTVVVDLTADSGAAAGRKFIIYAEGEDLKHPVTGKSLGRMEDRVAEGEIREVLTQYSVGVVRDVRKPLVPGQRVRLTVQAPAPVAAPAPAAATSAAPSTQRAAWRSPILQLEAVDLDIGDTDGDGTKDIVLADARHVKAFPAKTDPAAAWEPFCAYEDKNTGTKFLSLEAMDLNGDGRAEVFATYHNDFFGRVETIILDCRKGSFESLGTVPWMVRSTYDAAGARSLVAQALVPDYSFPFGAIYPLRYAEGKYQLGPDAVRLKRLDWIYSFAQTAAESGNDPIVVSYDLKGHLRSQFRKNAWSSPELLGQTSNRVRWHERLLKFTPRLPTLLSDKGFAGVYVVRNIPRLGGMAEAFGMYGRGEVQKLRWNGMGLEREWSAETDGYVAGLTSTDEPGNPAYAAVVSPNGSTSVLKFTP